LFFARIFTRARISAPQHGLLLWRWSTTGVEPEAVSDRTDMVRERLRFGQDGGPEITFSVGCAYLPPGASPDAALKAADEAMYRDKADARSRSHAVTR